MTFESGGSDSAESALPFEGVVLDLTGRPAGHSSAYLGKRISWQAFREVTRTPKGAIGCREMQAVAPHQYVNSVSVEALDLSSSGEGYEIAPAITGRPQGCPIPEGAVMRARQPRRPTEPRPLPQYWLGRECRFPRRYSDPTRNWRGWAVKRPHELRTMVEMLRPLSAKTVARYYTQIVAIPATPPKEPRNVPPLRSPLAEEHVAGRLSARHVNAADWFAQDIVATAAAKADGVRMRTSSGAMVAYGSRDPMDMWPAEASADRAIRLRSRFRTLGPLAKIVWRALNGAEMAALAPAWSFPQRQRAEAGRIRLRAGLELCARMAERGIDKLPLWEVLEIAKEACTECSKLEATRRMRIPIPANDNMPKRIAA